MSVVNLDAAGHEVEVRDVVLARSLVRRRARHARAPRCRAAGAVAVAMVLAVMQSLLLLPQATVSPLLPLLLFSRTQFEK